LPVWVFHTSIALPLDITLFNGQQVDKQVNLNWVTAQELNNDHFEIEHSADGIHYERIGSVNSRFQTSSTSTDYSFTDRFPKNGMNFYRLKEVNISGAFSYSDVVPVKFDNPLVDIISVSPNPSISKLSISCRVLEATPVTCSFYNSEGRIVRKMNYDFTTGQNLISTDVSALPAGIYFIVISRPNERLAEAKFLKQ